MAKQNSDFKHLVSAYMLAHPDEALPYESGMDLTCIKASGSWRVTFRHDGEVFETYISSEDLLGWMWSRMSASFTA